ncbi:AraC family transcriptional regulator [Opitutaceae bacterium EW11]|nr:AraC family transcriptional regulator [Opitutaceae bacterium EW11]
MLENLVKILARHTAACDRPLATAVPGLTLMRADKPKRPNHILFRPALCLVAQGGKWATFGDRRIDYRAGQALIVTAEVPMLGRVAEASVREPYLGLVLELDQAVMREVLSALENPPAVDESTKPGVFSIEVDGPLADATLRLVRLLDTPQAIRALYPAIMREITYWLLSGPHGAEVIRMALAQSHERRIAAAIRTLRQHFAKQVRIEDLAKVAGMSPSVFHRHFKAVTALSPLQYQKRLRLLEARRLMVDGDANVETAAFEVGYESASQFSREYSRMFGAPPRRDVETLARRPGAWENDEERATLAV